MRCKRCHGLIVMESCADAEFSERSAGVSAIRCINCGTWELWRVAQRSGDFGVTNLRDGSGEICTIT